MITGFNTNVRYRGRLFHVQTEDSGTRNPHVISHVYHGGTVLASERSDYAEHLGSARLEDEVRALMEAQHKAMLRRLKNAELDRLIAERLDGVPPSEASTSPSVVDAEPPAAPAAAPAAAAPRSFGDGIVSEKPLDEVILEYLAQKARERKSRAGSRAGPRAPAKG